MGKTLDEKSEYISLQEATEYCNYSQEYLSLRARRGKLKAAKFGRNWVTKKEWLKEYLKKTEENNNHLKVKLWGSKRGFRAKEFFQIRQLRFAVIIGLVFVLLTAGITFGKESFKNVYENPFLLVQPVEDFIVNTAKETSKSISNGFQKFNRSVTRGTIKIAEDISYFADDFVEEKIAQTIIQGYTIADDFIEEKISLFGKQITKGGQEIAEMVSTGFKKKIVIEKVVSVPEITKKEIETLKEKIAKLEKEEMPAKEIIREIEVSKITKIESVKEITKEKIITKIDEEELKKLKAQVAEFSLWRTDIEELRNITKKLQSRPTATMAASAPIYIASQGLQVGGAGIFASLGVSGSAGIGNLGVGGSTSLGSTGSDSLTVNATSTFRFPVTAEAGLTIGTSTLVVDSLGNLTTTGNITTTGIGDITVAGNLTVAGTQTFTKSPTLPHTFEVWSIGVDDSNVSDASLFLNPSTAVDDANLFGIAVGDSVKFLIDAEGNVFANDLTTVGSVNMASTTISTLKVEGHTILGDANTDLITTNARFSSSLIPSTDNTYDLGKNTAPLRWQTGYFGTSVVIGDTVTIGSDEITASGALTVSTSDWDISVTGAITNATYEGLTLTEAADGFSLAGGTTNERTLTVSASDITLKGGGYTLELAGNLTTTIGAITLAANAGGTSSVTLPATGTLEITGHTHTLLTGATDVDAAAAELNLLDLSGLSVGYVLRATGAAAASWAAIQDSDLPSALTGKTYEGLTLSEAADGFSLAGGTTNERTLTVSASDITLKGGGYTLELAGNLTTTIGAITLAANAGGTSSVTLPATGTLATTDASSLTSGNLDIARLPTSGNWDISSGLSIETSTLFIGATGGSYSGNVGIGTVSPADFTLQVAGDIGPDATPGISSISRTNTQITDAEDVGYQNSITIGADYLPVISYFNDTDDDLMIIKCGNSSCSSGNTTTQIIDAENVGDHSSIAIGTDGLPIISYHNGTDTDLMIIKCGNSSCSSGNTTTQIIDADNMGSYSSIAIGTDGLPIISYLNTTDWDLMITKCGNSSCSSNTTTQIIDAENVGGYTSIAIGTDSLPIISYLNITDWDLMIIKCGNSSCSSGNTTTQIIDAENVGTNTSIAIGTDGLPIISYRNITDTDLMIIKCGNSSCSSGNTTTQITDAEDVGGYSSIAIGTDGLPIISYRNDTDTDLMIIKCADPGCSQASGHYYSSGSDLGSLAKFFNNVYAVRYWGKDMQISNFDVAEEYPVADFSLEAGDVVGLSLSSEPGIVDYTQKMKKSLSPESPRLQNKGFALVKAHKSSDSKVIGVVSSQPGIALKNWENPTDLPTKLVALVGRVPVKVCLENGAIELGDYLTASSQPGIAMKATESGRVLGTALESYNGFNQEGDKIMLFVNPGWYGGSLSEDGLFFGPNTDSSEKDLNSTDFGQKVKLVLEQLGLFIQNGIVKIQELVADKITAKKLCIEDVCIDREQFKELLEKNQITTNKGGSGDSCQTQTFYLDADGDGYGDLNNSALFCTAPAGYVLDNTDCNDNNSTVNPGAVEVCDDGIDNNCDSKTDSEDKDCQAVEKSVEVKPQQPTDTTPPVITLLGDTTVNISINDAYIDAGAFASDDTDGDITAQIVVDNPVDNSQEGTYIITYNVSDTTGNAASEVIRTINVVVTIPSDADGDGVIDTEDACPETAGDYCNGCLQPDCSGCQTSTCPEFGEPTCQDDNSLCEALPNACAVCQSGICSYVCEEGYQEDEFGVCSLITN